MLSYNEMPEFTKSMRALGALRAKVQACKTSREIAIFGIIRQVREVSGNRKLEGEKLMEIEEALLAEKIHGGKSVEALTDKANQQVILASRSEFFLSSLSKMSLIAERLIEKKIEELGIEREDFRNMLNGVDAYIVNKTDLNGNYIRKYDPKKCKERERLRKEYTAETVRLDGEIQRFQEDLKTLKALNPDNKVKRISIGDRTLVEEAEACKVLAVETYKILDEQRKPLVLRLEANREKIKEMKSENIELETAISSLFPESVGDILTEYEILDILWPEAVKENFRASPSSLKHFISNKIRAAVKGYE